NRERELISRQQRQQAGPERQNSVVQPVAGPQAAADLPGIGAAPAAPARKRGKPTKDPTAPKRPLTAFFHFLKDYRHQDCQRGKHVTEVTTAAGIAWAAMSEQERDRWYEQAAEDKERYDREMAEYQGRDQ
ncbi:hypothetical protein AAVH_36372, partial [Aphelenchoides avenae]